MKTKKYFFKIISAQLSQSWISFVVWLDSSVIINWQTFKRIMILCYIFRKNSDINGLKGSQTLKQIHTRTLSLSLFLPFSPFFLSLSLSLSLHLFIYLFIYLFICLHTTYIYVGIYNIIILLAFCLSI